MVNHAAAAARLIDVRVVARTRRDRRRGEYNNNHYRVARRFSAGGRDDLAKPEFLARVSLKNCTGASRSGRRVTGISHAVPRTRNSAARRVCSTTITQV